MQVGRYEIVRELGRGGMARVHLARQVELDRLVALKELLELQREDAEMVGRFVRESRLAGALNHESIVTVLDVFEHDGVRYIAMEYVPRGSLRPWVGRLEPAQLGGVLESVLAGLAHAHAAGVVHRDLKPENLLVNVEGRVKIADFGIARALADGRVTMFQTATGVAVGTPAYMAPEQAMAQEIGPWTDLYSVGVIAYELLSGSVPFSADEPLAVLFAHCRDEPQPLTDRAPAVPSPLAGWVHRLLAKDPAQRPQSARAAWEELEEHLLEVAGPRWRRDARLEGEVAAPPPATAGPAPTTDRWSTVAGGTRATPAPGPADPAQPVPTPAPAPAEPEQSAPAPVPTPAPAPAPTDPPSERAAATTPPPLRATTPPTVDLPPAVTTRLPVQPLPAGPAAPRRRRRALLAAGAVAVVAAAVPVAVVLAGAGEAPRDRAAVKSSPEPTATASVTPTASPTATATATATAEPTATSAPRERRTPVATVASPKRPDDLPLALDGSSNIPSRVGDWSPYDDATFAAAQDAFGSDFVASPEPSAPEMCTVTWDAVGLTVIFANFGGGDPCESDSGRAHTIEIDGLASDRWRTLSGLRPGMPESAIAKLYDDAHEPDQGEWWLVTAKSPIGAGYEYAPISATVDEGVVSGFELFVGGAGD